VLDFSSSDFGVSQFVVVDPDTGLMQGMADPRKDGGASGL